MVKVLMINYEYPPLGGGTGIANHYLLKEFRHQPLTLDLLTSSPGKYAQSRLATNIRLIRLDIGKSKQNLHHQSYWDLFRFFYQSSIWVWQHRHEYDLIHAFSGLPGGITAWLSGLPYFISFRGADEPGYEPRHERLWQLIKLPIGFIYRRAHALDANSLYLKRLILNTWPDLKIKIIDNGVDSQKFYPAKMPVRLPVILSTSRLAPRKGVEYLIQAMALVPQAKLLLAGSGQLELTLKKLVRKLRLSHRVKFFGAVPHDNLGPI
ncbi:MAG: glycosyltransferase, partial [Candidatus Beckwithbacteria bacterium]|nr:glycosyltransferase [Candidatus Beckwithbacteria bacterium]